MPIKLGLLFYVLSGICFHPAYAENIQRIYNNDGSVEFSNVKKSVSKHTVIYKSQTGKGYVFSDQKPQHGNYEVLKYSCFACNPSSSINWHTIRLNTTSYRQEVKNYAKRYDVDAALIRAIMHAESGFKADAISRTGAQGLMQLMPATADELGVKNAFDAKQNIEGGVKYLAELLILFDGDVRLATAAYNAGPNAVKKYNGIPPYSETKVYVERVGILHRRYQHDS
ncbi:MAG TPA: lytic transglycosylase domain-containing protein [Methylophaga aminisulfidivorans]|uniref:Lytic transglycosylase domain-containing protein n=1 Tax=Methylophaga aminisulfidivorans TaxID=230105 RepID=A0A7C1W4G2_9GAMM|nr:lytic transglycosylase domain-containing protein [Methylophaga aminisulfidivorans]